MDSFGERLLEERKRLGMNQAQFASSGGVMPRAQVYYEKDERRPDANYLMAIAAAGADVGYILTGVRSRAAGQASAPAGGVPGYPEITPKMLIEALQAIEEIAIKQHREIRAGKLHRLVLMLCRELVDRQRASPDKAPCKVGDLDTFRDFMELAS